MKTNMKTYLRKNIKQLNLTVVCNINQGFGKYKLRLVIIPMESNQS
jgi:hypothetical protein